MSDGGFSAAWLDLREPADHAARDKKLLSRASAYASKEQAVLDLGSGTGSTARAFNGLVPNSRWRFLDGDGALLGVAADRHPGSQQIVSDLRDIDALPLSGVSLVTASALLDLMPESWIEALALRLRAQRIPLYAALNYNGRMVWTPSLFNDGSITASFNEHQLTDKGIGLAAGPEAANLALRIFGNSGFEVRRADSPWKLDGNEAALQDQLLSGIADAAAEVGNKLAPGWLEARLKMIPQSAMVVGHTDLLAVPT